MEMHAPIIDAPANRGRGRVTMIDDERSDSFGLTPRTVACETSLSIGARGTYTVLACHWWRTGECRLSHQRLADLIGCSLPQLRRYLRELVAGDFVVARRWGDGQAKAYSPTQPITGEQLDRSPVSSSTVNCSPVITSVIAGEQFNRSPVIALNKSTGETGENRPELPETGGRGGASADASPPPAPDTQPVKTSKRRKALPSECTPPPAGSAEEIAPPELIRWAAANGYERAVLFSELDRCLDYHRQEGTRTPDWIATYRTWLRKEIAYAATDKRALGDHTGPRRSGGGPPRQNAADRPTHRRDGSRIYSASRGAALPDDLQAMIDDYEAKQRPGAST